MKRTGYLESSVEDFTLSPYRVNLYVPPIQWKGDPTGHIGENDTFFWVVAGECYVTIETESFIVKAGQLAFLPKGKMRIYSSLSEDLVMYEMNFAASINSAYWYTQLELQGENYAIDIADPERMSRWFETSLRHEMNKDIAYDIIWCCNLANILCTYVTERKRADQRTEFFKDVIKYMNDHIHSCLTIDTLAGIACMQPTYFIRRFKAAFGFSPIVYFNKLKVYKAMTLLSSTDFSLQKIAARLGISDAAYLSRMFKKYCSISPAKYRALFRQDMREM